LGGKKEEPQSAKRGKKGKPKNFSKNCGKAGGTQRKLGEGHGEVGKIREDHWGGESSPL